jgi:hypothetical protein
MIQKRRHFAGVFLLAHRQHLGCELHHSAGVASTPLKTGTASYFLQLVGV